MRLLVRRRLLGTSALTVAVSTVGLVGCGSSTSDDPLATQGSPVVAEGTPAYTPPSQADLAALGVRGYFSQAAPSGAPASSGQFSATTDLDVDPTPITGAAPVNASPWLALATPSMTAPDFAGDLATATRTALSLATPNTSDVTSVWTSVISDIFGNPNVQSSGQSFYGWTPVVGRYLQWQEVYERTCSGRICLSGLGSYTYPDPPDLDEQRERGARLYCAARTAQQKQGSSTFVMGEEAAVSFSLLGKQIQLLTVEPMVTIDGPQRWTGSGADGAQAFVVPMKFGTRITPIKGFGLPSLPEIRYPVALVTGDSEAITQADYQHIVTNAGTYTGYSKNYMTVDHMDGYVAGAMSASSSNKMLLFTVGPVDVDLTLGLQVQAGQSAIAPGRLLDVTGLEGSVVPRTTLQQTATFMDGPWAPNDVAVGGNIIAPFWAQPGPVDLATYDFPPAFYTRAIQDDDHYLQGGQTALTLNGTLSGILGFDFGPVNVSLDLSGGLSGSVQQLHMVRDAAFAQVPGGAPGMIPVTGLVVRPRTEANVTLGPLSATLNFEIDFALFSVNWSAQLFSTGTTTLASYDSDATNAWPASSNLRIGTGSGLGSSIRDQPTVDTQLPGGSTFRALPESVSACLSDDTANPPDAPPCTGAPADTGSAPSANLCAESPHFDIGGSFCAAEGSSTTLPTPTTYQQCAADIARYLCGQSVRDDLGYAANAIVGATQLNALGNEIAACGKLAYAAGLNQQSIEAYLRNLLSFDVCDASAVPIPNLFSAGSATTPPTVGSGGACR
jgi:hypothetical protein